MRFVLIYIFLFLGVFACSSTAQSKAADDAIANPGRPTVSSPATPTPLGYVQFETGVLAAYHSPEFSSRYGLNEVIKFSVVPRLELVVSAEPISHSIADGNSSNRAGDVFLGAQGVLIRGEGSKPTIAAGYFHHVFDGGATNLDFGSPANSVLLLVSADVIGFHYDTNAIFNEVVQGTTRRAQFGQTLSISHVLVGKFAVSGEIWHFNQPFIGGEAVGNLWAVSYTLRKTIVLDAGFNRGLTSTSTRWEAFAGFTYLLPRRLFGR